MGRDRVCDGIWDCDGASLDCDDAGDDDSGAPVIGPCCRTGSVWCSGLFCLPGGAVFLFLSGGSFSSALVGFDVCSSRSISWKTAGTPSSSCAFFALRVDRLGVAVSAGFRDLPRAPAMLTVTCRVGVMSVDAKAVIFAVESYTAQQH